MYHSFMINTNARDKQHADMTVLKLRETFELAIEACPVSHSSKTNKIMSGTHSKNGHQGWCAIKLGTKSTETTRHETHTPAHLQRDVEEEERTRSMVWRVYGWLVGVDVREQTKQTDRPTRWTTRGECWKRKRKEIEQTRSSINTSLRKQTTEKGGRKDEGIALTTENAESWMQAGNERREREKTSTFSRTSSGTPENRNSSTKTNKTRRTTAERFEPS